MSTEIPRDGGTENLRGQVIIKNDDYSTLDIGSEYGYPERTEISRGYVTIKNNGGYRKL